MNFDNGTFQEINRTSNNIVRTRLYSFEGEVHSSGLSIKIPIRGTENYFVDNSYYELSENNFLLVNHGQRVGCKFNSDQVVDSICIYLDYQNYTEVLNDVVQDEPFNSSTMCDSPEVIAGLYPLDKSCLSSKLQTIISSGSLSNFSEEDYIALIEALAIHQCKQQKIMTRISAKKRSTRKELLRRLQIAKSFIFDNYQKDIDLDDIAKACYLSKYYLLRSFKSAYKKTPYQALTERRIDVAKDLLSKGNDIYEVAMSCGFNDRRSFSRTFKNIIGQTPTTYQVSKQN